MAEAPDIVIAPFNVDIWEDDRDMVNLRRHFKGEIRTTWDKGMEAFVAGDWTMAKEQFHKVLEMSNNKDGPSKLLLQKMHAYDSKAPPNWQGYRSLY